MSARIRITALALIALSLGLLAPAPAACAEDAAEPMDEKAQAAELIALMKGKDPTATVRALEKAQTNQHASLLSPMQRLLSDRELGVRLAAIEALGTRTEKSARKKAASSLASRLARLSKGRADAEELALVIETCGTLGQRAAIKPLLDPIDLEMDLEEVKARLQAVAHIPHEDSVESLIDFLAKGRRGGRQKQRREAHNALRYLTGGTVTENRTAGKDADRWRAWWKDNKKTCDLEAVAEARKAAEAEKAAKAERKRKQKEERKRKQEEKRKKRGEKKAPKPKPPAPID